MKPVLLSLIAFWIMSPLYAGLVEEVRWRENHQKYDLVLSPETIPTMTGHAFETYEAAGVRRLVISDRDDGLWRAESGGSLYQETGPEQPLSELEGDQHTLSFYNMQNVLIERLDLYAHEVEEALKFSACANIVVRDCRLVAGRNSEDATDIVRGQNYIFDGVWFIGLGEREMTIKGSARYVDIVESQFGLRTAEAFREVFRSETVLIGDTTFSAGDPLMPKETIPNWIYPCLLLSDERSLGIEVGAWSIYDIGYRNSGGELEERPPTSDVRVEATFAHAMEGSCDEESDMVPVLQWHTAERVQANAWIFRPAETEILGELVEAIYYEVSEPSAQEEAAIREELGAELDYFGVELPRYALEAGDFGNNRFFGALYNAGNGFLYSPFAGWLHEYEDALLGHDFPDINSWFFRLEDSSFYALLYGDLLPVSYWWNANTESYFSGSFNPYP